MRSPGIVFHHACSTDTVSGVGWMSHVMDNPVYVLPATHFTTFHLEVFDVIAPLNDLPGNGSWPFSQSVPNQQLVPPSLGHQGVVTIFYQVVPQSVMGTWALGQSTLSLTRLQSTYCICRQPCTPGVAGGIAQTGHTESLVTLAKLLWLAWRQLRILCDAITQAGV